MGKLEGKVAVITASTRSIGRGIAEAYLAEGAKVVVSGRSEEKGAAALEADAARRRDRAHRVVEVAEDARREAGVGVGAEHRERLARARLPVREQVAVEAAEDGVGDRQPHRLEEVVLRRRRPEDAVEGEGARLGREVDERARRRPRLHADRRGVRGRRADAHRHLDAVGGRTGRAAAVGEARRARRRRGRRAGWLGRSARCLH
mgnify:CR=1 FL=1